MLKRQFSLINILKIRLKLNAIFIFFLIFILPSELFSATLIETLKAKIQSEIPNIIIENLAIEPPKLLPPDFSDYKLEDIFLLSMRDENGNMRAKYITPKNISKSMFFKFKIKAKVPALIAIKDLSRGQILTNLDYKIQNIDLKDYNKNILTSNSNIKLISTTNIKRNTILTNRQFKTLSDVKKGDTLMAVLIDGNLNVQIEVTALDDANIGEIFKVKTENNQIFKATLISKNRAEIR